MCSSFIWMEKAVWVLDQPLNSYYATLVYCYFIEFELGIKSSPCDVNLNHAWYDLKMPKPTKALIVLIIDAFLPYPACVGEHDFNN